MIFSYVRVHIGILLDCPCLSWRIHRRSYLLVTLLLLFFSSCLQSVSQAHEIICHLAGSRFLQSASTCCNCHLMVYLSLGSHQVFVFLVFHRDRRGSAKQVFIHSSGLNFVYFWSNLLWSLLRLRLSHKVLTPLRIALEDKRALDRLASKPFRTLFLAQLPYYGSFSCERVSGSDSRHASHRLERRHETHMRLADLVLYFDVLYERVVEQFICWSSVFLVHFETVFQEMSAFMRNIFWKFRMSYGLKENLLSVSLITCMITLGSLPCWCQGGLFVIISITQQPIPQISAGLPCPCLFTTSGAIQ